MDHSPTTERRLISRILLATVAVVVVLLLSALVGVIRMARHRAALVESITSRFDGSSVIATYEPYEYSPPPHLGLGLYWRGGQRVHSFSVSGDSPFWADWVAKIFDDEPFAEVYRVVNQDERFSDADLDVLFDFPGLHELDLSSTGITDRGVSTLCEKCKLAKLDLSQTQITDHSLQALDKLPELRELDISDTRTTKEAVESFQKRHPRCLVFD
jgi:Leucine Rich Repeat (LRR) protein